MLAIIAQTIAALTKLKPIWNDNTVTISSKIRVMRSLVIAKFLYTCKMWTPTDDLEKKYTGIKDAIFLQDPPQPE